jgi:hypothetical protein
MKTASQYLHLYLWTINILFILSGLKPYNFIQNLPFKIKITPLERKFSFQHLSYGYLFYKFNRNIILNGLDRAGIKMAISIFTQNQFSYAI